MHLIRLIAAAVIATAATTAQAQGFPSKAVTIIVPFAAGGSNDIVARAVGDRLGKLWGQPVVIDNKPGAGATIGMTAASKAKPDGYTLVIASVTFTMVPAVRSDLPYDPAKSLVPVAKLAKSPLVAALGPAIPAKTVDEFLKAVRAKPGHYTFATAGVGGLNHFATELLMQQAGLEMTHVPYKGGAPAMTDVIGGHTGMYLGSIIQILPHLRAGRMTGIAVTSLERSPSAPDIPTFDEAGLKGYEMEQWWGILAPAGVPEDVLAKLNADINKVIATDDMKALFAKDGAVPTPISQDAFAKQVAADLARWKKVAAERKITIN